MVYETSYESGRKPFTPDKKRGKWSSPNDFAFACMGLGLKLDLFTNSWFFFFELGLVGVLVYGVAMLLYVVPLMVIHSFLGQFSTSGYISVFRISPLFKGMGFVALALNLSFLTFYSAFVAVPILFLLYSFNPTLPWSCEGYKNWAHLIKDSEKFHLCNLTFSNVTNITYMDDGMNITEEIVDFRTVHVPSELFFKSHFTNLDFTFVKNEISISWMLLFCAFITWALIAGFFYKFNNTEKLGQFLRYAVLLVLVTLFVCLCRFMFLPGALRNLVGFFIPSYVHAMSIESIPFYGLSAFGAGWGSIITLASFNHFKADVMRYSWIICSGQMLLMLLFSLTQNILEGHFASITKEISDKYYVEQIWILYLSSGSALANMMFANFWCILFYSMLALAGLIVMITQLYVTLVSLFDEFEILRERKLEVTFGLIGMMTLSSIYFCTNHGLLYHSTLSIDSLFTQSMLHLLLILVALWVYRRERFQRDIEFMLGQRFATWKVNLVRFVAPIFLFITLMAGLMLAYFEHSYSTWVMHVLGVIYLLLPWLFIPLYAVFIMVRTTGLWWSRFKRVCRPTDWYPVEMEDRQRYEEAVGNVDITHQLNEVTEEVCNC